MTIGPGQATEPRTAASAPSAAVAAEDDVVPVEPTVVETGSADLPDLAEGGEEETAENDAAVDVE